MGKSITSWGKQCKAQMALMGLSLCALSKEVNLTPTYVSAIINGRLIAPDETINKINKALRIGFPLADK